MAFLPTKVTIYDALLGLTTDGIVTDFDGNITGLAADGVTLITVPVTAGTPQYVAFSQINSAGIPTAGSGTNVYALVGTIPTTGGGGGGGGAVTIADGADTTQGAKANAADLAGTGTSTLVSLMKGAVQNLVLLLARNPAALGQGTMAQGYRVVIPSDQSAVASKSADGDFATLGAKADAADLAGTGTSTAISLLKGGVQNLVLLLAKLPASLGIKTAANSLSVAPASDAVFSNVPTDGSGSGTITTQNLNPSGPSAATAGSAVQITLNADGVLTIDVRGTYTGALTPQVSINGNDWVTLPGNPVYSVSAGTYAATIASATVGIFRAEVGGYAFFRMSANAAVTGTATVTLHSSDASTVTGNNIAQFAGVTLSTGSGAAGAGVPRVTISNDAYPSEGSGPSGNPMRVGGVTRTTAATNLTGSSINVSHTMTRSNGQLLVKPYGIPDLDWNFASAVITASGNVTLNAAAGASVRNYCTGLQYQNTNGTATEITITDGNAGTILWRGYAAANMALAQDIEFNTPLQGTANTLLALNVATASANLYFNAQGYKAA